MGVAGLEGKTCCADDVVVVIGEGYAAGAVGIAGCGKIGAGADTVPVNWAFVAAPFAGVTAGGVGWTEAVGACG